VSCGAATTLTVPITGSWPAARAHATVRFGWMALSVCSSPVNATDSGVVLTGFVVSASVGSDRVT